MTDLDARRAALLRRATQLHELWMATNLGSSEETRLARAVEDAEAEYDAVCREEEAQWGKNDTRILHDIGRGHNASEL